MRAILSKLREQASRIPDLRMMKVGNKKLIKIAICLIIVFSALFFWIRNVPHLVEQMIVSGLSGYFSEDFIKVGERIYNGNTITLNNIQLDKSGIDTIESVQARFSLWSYFGFINIQSLHITSPVITRPFAWPDEKNFTDLNAVFLNSAFVKKIDYLEISDGKIDIATDYIGAVRLNFNGNFRYNAQENRSAFQWNIESAQKGFLLSSKISGFLIPFERWEAEVSTDRLGLEIENYGFKRASMAFSAGGTYKNEFFLNGETNIGAVDINGYLFKEVAGSLEYTQNELVWTLGGSALDQSNIEAGLSYNSNESAYIQGSLYADKLSGLYSFLWPDTSNTDLENSPLAKIKDIFFSLTFLKNEIFSGVKKIRITAETFDLQSLPAIFPGFIPSAQGQIKGQIIAELDNKTITPIQGFIRSHGQGSIKLSRKGSRAISGSSRNAKLEKLNEYQGLKIDFKGNVFDRPEWKMEIIQDNQENSIFYTTNKNLKDLKAYLIRN